MEITQEHQPQLPAPMPDNAQLCLREMQDLTIKQDCDISGSPIRPDSGEHVKDGFDEAWEDLMQEWMDNKCDTHTWNDFGEDEDRHPSQLQSLTQCRLNVYDAGPTINQHWLSISRLLWLY